MMSRVVGFLMLAAAPAAAAFTVVLGNDTTHTRITIAEVPTAHDAFVVAWQDVPGVTPATGAMIFSRDGDDDQTRYFAVGGGGLFAIVDRGGSHMISGTAMPVAYVISDDPQHPLAVVMQPKQHVDVAAVLASYARFENIAAPGETRAAIEAAVAAKANAANQACHSHVAVKLDWKSFATPASVALAKQAVSILEAIEQTCADKDYAAAVQATHELHVDYQASGGALRLEKTGDVVAAHLSDTSWNPRETAAIWLKDKL